jgi:hypothetical protein
MNTKKRFSPDLDAAIAEMKDLVSRQFTLRSRRLGSELGAPHLAPFRCGRSTDFEELVGLPARK